MYYAICLGLKEVAIYVLSDGAIAAHEHLINNLYSQQLQQVDSLGFTPYFNCLAQNKNINIVTDPATAAAATTASTLSANSEQPQSNNPPTTTAFKAKKTFLQNIRLKQFNKDEAAGKITPAETLLKLSTLRASFVLPSLLHLLYRKFTWKLLRNIQIWDSKLQFKTDVEDLTFYTSQTERLFEESIDFQEYSTKLGTKNPVKVLTTGNGGMLSLKNISIKKKKGLL